MATPGAIDFHEGEKTDEKALKALFARRDAEHVPCPRLIELKG
jgi:hypothetical protein